MQRFWSWLAVEAGKRAGAIAAVALILTGVLGFGITQLKFATGQDSYLNKTDEVYTENVEYQKLFGGQAMLTVISLDKETDLANFVVENRELLEDVGDTINSNEGVLATVSPLTAIEFSNTLIQKGPDGQLQTDVTKTIAGRALADAANLIADSKTQQALRELPGSKEEAARQKASIDTLTRLNEVNVDQRRLDNPKWVDFLLRDNDGGIRKALLPFFPNDKTAQIIVRLKGNMSIEEEGAAASFVTDTVDAAKLQGGSTVTVGAPTLLQDINNYLRKGILSLGAIAVGVMIVVLLTMFAVRWRLLPMLIVCVGVIWAFGLAGYLGIPLSLVTISGLPVMLGVGIDYAIQMHARIEEEVIVDRSAHPIQESARNLGPGLLVVTFDAVFSFVALWFAKVPMIREFGSLLIVGIIAICACSIIGPIALLGAREFRSPTQARDFREGTMSRVVVKLGSLPQWVAVPFALVSLLVLVGGVSVESKIKLLADPVEWVNQSSNTIKKIDRVKATTGSSAELGVYVQSAEVFDQDTVTEVNNLAGCALGGFPETAERDDVMTKQRCAKEYLAEQFVVEKGERKHAFLTASGVVATISSLLELPGASVLPPNSEDVQAAWANAPAGIKSFTATPDGKAMNVIFRTGYSSLTDGKGVVKAYDEIPDGSLAKGDSAQPSGLAVVGVGLLDNIESNRSQLTYMSIAFVGLFLALRLRSLVRSILSLVPVLIATGMASLVAYILHLELSPMTAVGGPLVVAVCTEFTSLILLRFVEERKRGFNPQDAVDVAAARTGRAFVVSGTTAFIGVGVIATSSLPLLRGFGLIVGLNVVIALLSALIILPPMLVWADQEGREWVSRGLISDAELEQSRGGRSAMDAPLGGDPEGPGTVGRNGAEA